MRSRYDYKVKESNENSIKKYNHLLQDIERKTTSNKQLLHQFLKEKKLEVQQNTATQNMKLLSLEDELVLKDNHIAKLEDSINDLLVQISSLEN